MGVAEDDYYRFRAQLTVDVVTKVVQGKISINNAIKLLNKSRRTIERYLQKYQQVGIQFIVHRNVGKSPANKTSDELKRAVQLHQTHGLCQRPRPLGQ